MNKHPTALMLSLIGLLLTVMGLSHLHKVWRFILLMLLGAGVVIGWIIYFDILLRAL
jgi:hypothetical protein